MQNNHSISLFQTEKPNIYAVKLSFQKSFRFIGLLDKSGERTFITLRNAEQRFFKTDSLGINYHLLAHPEIKFKWILIDYCGKKLISTRQYFLKKGKMYEFSSKGFEKQLFVPIAELNLEQVNRFEQSRIIQHSLEL